jgi:putative Ca2+/H+ antiporter (TMEM165/GDT1 family)
VWRRYAPLRCALQLCTSGLNPARHLKPQVPELLSSGQSLPIGQWLGAALLVYFGIRNIQDSLKATPEPQEGKDATGELADAEEFVQSAASTKSGITAWGALVESFSLIFVAEWGDRSMLATIALGGECGGSHVGARQVLARRVGAHAWGGGGAW